MSTAAALGVLRELPVSGGVTDRSGFEEGSAEEKGFRRRHLPGKHRCPKFTNVGPTITVPLAAHHEAGQRKVDAVEVLT